MKNTSRAIKVYLLPLLLFLGCSEKISPEKIVLEKEEILQMSVKDFGPYNNEGLDREGQSKVVLEAMSRVPRHEFVPSDLKDQAYSDQALPIGSGQTISQPYIVSLMSSAAEVSQGARVLEIGTGSGYQAAVLSELGAKVYSIEIIPELADQARERLGRLGYKNVEIKTGDGWQGWVEHAPFDAILVTASAPKIPIKLISQLANKGKLVFPLEEESKKKEESLLVVERDGENIVTKSLGSVRFVPLTGEVREEGELDLSSPVGRELVEKFGRSE
jgi:protein-L-isoaspartate(D-aspartate) O-methyltransferase